MRAVPAACCLLVVCLLFARGDVEATPTPEACTDTETAENCEAWEPYCGSNVHVQTHCKNTCQLC
uniref:ShKL4 n=1 Tax=Colubraria reticulata TaxID=604273 RepID=A0A481SQ14_9CAEN|nr:ShKL4 [Colubraria reticulata]